MGITGLRFVELTRGTKKSAMLSPGSQIKAGTSTFDSLSIKAEVITAKIEILLDNVNLLASTKNIENISKIIENTAQITAELEQLLAENRPAIKALIASSGEVPEKVNVLLANLDANQAELFAGLAELVTKAKRLLKKTRIDPITKQALALLKHMDQLVTNKDLVAVLAKSNKLVSHLDTLVGDVQLTILRSKEEFIAILAYFLEVVENLNEFSIIIKEDPSVILSGPTIKEREVD